MELFSLQQLERRTKSQTNQSNGASSGVELVEASGELDDVEFERAADEIVREEREHYEEEAERSFVERSLTREEIQRRNTERFQKDDTADYREYDQEYLPEQKEFEPHEVCSYSHFYNSTIQYSVHLL